MAVFSDSSLGQGIVQQVRSMMRVDANQWPTAKIVASVNNYLDTVTGYAIGADRRFQWDDTNHTKEPIGTTNLVANQSDYSFLTDEQGNSILSINRVEVQDEGGTYRQLLPIDQVDIHRAIDEEQRTAGLPAYYDKIADNIIRLYPKPITSVSARLKFYFQRTGSYFVATDTTKSPGVSPLLHRGFVIASAYDGALTLGLSNLNALAVEMQREEAKMKEYFTNRNPDEVKFIKRVFRSSR
jgi:hypothetical protein